MYPILATATTPQADHTTSIRHCSGIGVTVSAIANPMLTPGPHNDFDIGLPRDFDAVRPLEYHYFHQ